MSTKKEKENPDSSETHGNGDEYLDDIDLDDVEKEVEEVEDELEFRERYIERVNIISDNFSEEQIPSGLTNASVVMETTFERNDRDTKDTNFKELSIRISGPDYVSLGIQWRNRSAVSTYFIDDIWDNDQDESDWKNSKSTQNCNLF